MSNVVEINEAQFETEVLKSDLPVAVDFWAPWCGPCRMMAPVLETTAAKTAGRIKFAKINTDENGGLAQSFGIMAIPTLILFRRGAEIDRLVGFISPAELETRLDAAAEAPAGTTAD